MHGQLSTCTLGMTDMDILAREKLIAKMEKVGLDCCWLYAD